MAQLIANDELGVTLDDLNGLRADFRLVSGPDALVVDLIARLRGKNPLINAVDEEYGLDLINLVNTQMSQSELDLIGTRVEMQCRNDPRVLDINVISEYDYGTEKLSLFIKGTTTRGQSFSFVGIIEPGVRPTFQRVY